MLPRNIEILCHRKEKKKRGLRTECGALRKERDTELAKETGMDRAERNEAWHGQEPTCPAHLQSQGQGERRGEDTQAGALGHPDERVCGAEENEGFTEGT